MKLPAKLPAGTMRASLYGKILFRMQIFRAQEKWDKIIEEAARAKGLSEEQMGAIEQYVRLAQRNGVH